MGKRLILALTMMIALALPMRTGMDAGQIVTVMPPPAVTKVVKKKKIIKYQPAPLTEKEKEIAAFVKRLNPTAKASTLARAIVKYAPQAHLPPELFASLLAHESGFKRELKVCFTWKGVGMCDHGLSQVNDYFWAGKFNFEKIRQDDVYAIRAGATILGSLHQQFGGQTNWWSTYNSTVPHNRRKYESLVFAKFSVYRALHPSVKI